MPSPRAKSSARSFAKPGANGIKIARWALDHVLDRSASPAETKVALALTLPCKIGGMGLPQPSLNRFIPLNAAEQKALNRSYFLCDLYWEQAKLAIEYDSDAEHSGSERIASDAARRNALLRLGITVITGKPDVSRQVGIQKGRRNCRAASRNAHQAEERTLRPSANRASQASEQPTDLGKRPLQRVAPLRARSPSQRHRGRGRRASADLKNP